MGCNKSILLLLHYCCIVATFVACDQAAWIFNISSFWSTLLPNCIELWSWQRDVQTFRLLDDPYRLKWCSHEHKRHIKTMEIWGTIQILPQIWWNLRFGRCRPGRSARISLPSSIECFAGAAVRRPWGLTVGCRRELVHSKSLFLQFSAGYFRHSRYSRYFRYSFIIGLYWMASLVVSSIPTTPIQPHLKAEEGRN